MTRCHTTDKVIYKSKTRATRAINALVNNRQGAFDVAHPYRCPDSPSHWHIGRDDDLDQGHAPDAPGLGDEKRKATRWNRADWDQATLTLWARCRDLCEWCGKALAGQLERHHRQRRAVGGDRLANLVALHPACHAWAHAHPEEARGRGVIVSAYEPDPASVPLVLSDGRAILLDDEGCHSPA